MNENFISVLTYLTEFFLFLPKVFVYDIIIVDINIIIKLPGLEFGEFFWIVGIWMLISPNSVTNYMEYFSETPIGIFGG